EQARSRFSGDQRGARNQRNPEVFDVEIEGQRHSLVRAVRLIDSIDLARNLDEIADARVLDRHALGFPGRAGGVDDVEQLIARYGFLAAREARGRFLADLLLSVVEKYLLDGELGEFRSVARYRNDRLQARILQDERDPVARKAGVEWHIGGADLEHCQERHIGMDGLVEQQADAVARLQALVEQEARGLVGSVVKLAE